MPGQATVTIKEEETVNLTGADRRIELVFYKSNPGEKASVRVIGKY